MRDIKIDDDYGITGNLLKKLVDYGKIVGNRKLTPDESRDLQNLIFLIEHEAVRL